ncbi:hypothetical protein BC628DRAFT_1052058 [Trametes gibbosa]|nr:hypothetical protein BC628DRAFT_1052058 [Trametes gibbosa]
MMKFTICTTLTWRPDEYFFLRFLDPVIDALPMRPSSGQDGEAIKRRSIKVYARVHGGTTARFAAMREDGALRSSRVLLDGPYGGVEGNIKVYDCVMLLAGGSGVARVVPLLLDIAKRRALRPWVRVRDGDLTGKGALLQG